MYVRQSETDSIWVEVPADSTVRDLSIAAGLSAHESLSFQNLLLDKDAFLSDAGVGAEATVTVVPATDFVFTLQPEAESVILSEGDKIATFTQGGSRFQKQSIQISPAASKNVNVQLKRPSGCHKYFWFHARASGFSDYTPYQTRVCISCSMKGGDVVTLSVNDDKFVVHVVSADGVTKTRQERSILGEEFTFFVEFEPGVWAGDTMEIVTNPFSI